jgi:EpsI family protein
MGIERIRLTVLIVLFAATFACVRVVTRYHTSQTRLPDWSAVPYQFDGWSGVDGEFDPVYGVDPAQTSLLRIYRQKEDAPVIVYVGFYGNLATILEVHNPERCYPGQGWTILSRGNPAMGLFRNKRIPSQEIVVDKNGNRRLVRWWFNAGSQPIKTRIRHIYAMLAMSTITGRTDGSIVRLESPIDHDGEAAGETRINEFQKRILPQLERALPL